MTWLCVLNRITPPFCFLDGTAPVPPLSLLLLLLLSLLSLPVRTYISSDPLGIPAAFFVFLVRQRSILNPQLLAEKLGREQELVR